MSAVLMGAASVLASHCVKLSPAEAAGVESPLKVTLSLKETNPQEGVSFRVEIQNVGSEAHTLHVCPAMLLCCVKGLHPMISYGETGMGLRDICKKAKPTKHEVYLPKSAAFSFDMTIPPTHLPESSETKGGRVIVSLCYDLADGKQTHSNSVDVALPSD